MVPPEGIIAGGSVGLQYVVSAPAQSSGGERVVLPAASFTQASWYISYNASLAYPCPAQWLGNQSMLVCSKPDAWCEFGGFFFKMSTPTHLMAVFILTYLCMTNIANNGYTYIHYLCCIIYFIILYLMYYIYYVNVYVHMYISMCVRVCV